MAQVNVTQEHNNPARDGVYVDPPFAFSAAASVTRDMEFDDTIPAMFKLNHFTSKTG